MQANGAGLKLHGNRTSYLVVGQGMDLRHDGGGFRSLFGISKGIASVQAVQMA